MISRLPSFADLSDEQLLAEVKRLAAMERRATVGLIRALMELDARRLYLAEGYSSLFTYCTQALHLAEGAAYNRIETARATRRFPTIDQTASAPDLSPAPAEGVPVPAVPAPCSRNSIVSPLAPERFKVQLTISRETHDKLTRVQALSRHAIPGGDLTVIFDRALTLLLNDLERRVCATAASPHRPAETSSKSRRIPAAVKREVWRRDEGRCAFVGREGRCPERSLLEYHHVQPYGVGGAASTANIELRCRAHNAYEAVLFFGSDSTF